jgi:S1-C subfamily serine protease
MSDGSHVPSAPASADDGSHSEKLPVLAREAVLPRERGKGMAGIAIVCSMAGVASGLALAATLMAVQIADRSQHEQRSSGCWRRSAQMVSADPRGWLGVEFLARPDGGHVTRVFSGTAADAAGLRVGDVIRTVNGESIDRPNELSYLIRNAGAGARPELTVQRGDEELQVAPRLTSYPVVLRY